MPRNSRVLADAEHGILIDAAPDGIVIINQEGGIVDVNAQTEKLFGYGRTELLNQPIEVLVPERFREKLRGHRTSFIGRPQLDFMEAKTEVYGRRKDETEFPVVINLSPIETEGGLLVCGVIRDSRWAEIALRASEVRYRRLFETAKDGILILDAKTGQVMDVNPFLSDLLGYSHAEFLGKRLWEIGPFRDIEACRTAFRELQSTEYIRYNDLPLQTKDGRSIAVEFVSNVYREDAGYVIQCNIRDTTERKVSEEALLRSEERYRALFEQDSAGDYISGPDGRFLACNSAFARMFGFVSTQEAKDAGLATVYPIPEAREAFLQRLREEKKLENYNELRRRDGTLLPVVERVIGVFDHNGELIEIHGYLIDDSERRRTEQQIRQAQKMDAIGRLAGGLAHDFNNLLGVIIGHSELLTAQVGPDDTAHNRLVEISKAAHSGAALTRQLLAFTRQQVLQPRVLDLNAIVVETNTMLRRLIGEDIELVSNLGADLGAVKADPNQLIQVLLNLAVNSRDAMPTGGRLAIETASMEVVEDNTARSVPLSRSESYVVMRVTDTGIGMDKETQSRIFEPFFTSKGLGKGTGLGLATVYGIIRQSGGHIAVHSEPGQGTTFEIFLPRSKEDCEMSQLEPLLVEIPRGSETILLVEDSTDLRDIIRQFLVLSGYRVLESGTSSGAVQTAEQHPGPIHLILTDVVLPDLSGRVLAERLMVARPEARVLFMSGYAGDTIMFHEVSDAAFNFIQKPFTQPTLMRKVREILDEARSISKDSAGG